MSSHSILSSNLNTKLMGRDAELELMQEKLSALEIENALMSSRLNELAETCRQLQENYSAWIQSQPAETVPVAPTREEPAPAAGTSSMPLSVPSGSIGRPVRLRVPMAP